MPQQKRGRKTRPESSFGKISYSSSSSSLSSSDLLDNRINYPSSPKLNTPPDPFIALKISEEPTHQPSADDVSRTIQVYSHSKKDLIEVKAIFVNDVDENWISKGLVDRLTPEFPFKEQGYRHIALRTVKLLGTIKIQWTLNSLKTAEADCLIVKADCFDLYLRKCLLPPSAGSLQRTSRTPSGSIHTPVPIMPEDSFTSLPSPPISVCCFDGLTLDGQPKLIDDSAEESLRADDWITKLKSTVHRYTDKPSEQLRSAPAVKIAVLDTGIESKHPSIKGALKTKRIQASRSFVNNENSAEDSFGHGTHVANLLLNVAPNAELYVAKITKEGIIPPDHNIAKAIRWAINLNVDIITMSFGLGNHQKEIEDAVKEAYSKSILLFAAASNDGGNSPVTYPARYDDVICIFSTDGWGNGSKCNPTPLKNASNFATLGEAVKSAWPTHLPDSQGERRMTGTSFATPIAAGVAACVLEFSLLNIMDDEQYQVLKCRKGMQALFFERLTEERNGLRYIHPWKLFDTIRKEDTILTLIEDVLKCLNRSN